MLNDLVVKMEGRGILVVLAAIAVTISAEFVTFPETAREFTESRIVSGWEADDGQFPFMFSLRMVANTGAVSSCGGSIIHPQWGLTAAHCTAARITFVIRVGSTNLTRPSAIFETTEFYNYPLYDNDLPAVVQPHDIGLLKFGRTLQFNDYVQPIRLQRSEAKDRNFDGVQLIASGWGRTWTNENSTEKLNWVFLRGTTNFLCRMQFGTIIQDSTICARGYNDSTQSTCQGDSGGPLTAIDSDGEISQVGVTSFVSGAGCHVGFPAGFIRPGHYHDWYTEVTGVNFDWVSPDTTTAAPEEVTTETPEEATTEGPEEATTAASEEDSSVSSEEDSSVSSEEVPEAPEEATTAAPEEEATTIDPVLWDPICDEVDAN